SESSCSAASRRGGVQLRLLVDVGEAQREHLAMARARVESGDDHRSQQRREPGMRGTTAPSRSSHRGRVGVDSRHQDFIVSTVYTMTRTPDLLPGTLDLLILRTLQKDALHGWAISERIQ